MKFDDVVIFLEILNEFIFSIWRNPFKVVYLLGLYTVCDKGIIFTLFILSNFLIILSFWFLSFLLLACSNLFLYLFIPKLSAELFLFNLLKLFLLLSFILIFKLSSFFSNPFVPKKTTGLRLYKISYLG